MDTFNIGSINYNELYKLHTGHILFDSDSDSSDSIVSSSPSFWEENKPPLYSYEELEANSVVQKPPTEPVAIQIETRLSERANQTLEVDESPKKILRRKLESLACSDYCYLCNADLNQPANAQSHYKSYRHKDNVYFWKIEEMKKLQPSKLDSSISKTVEQVQGRKTLETDKSPNEILRNELENLICSDYCYLCHADLPQAANARSHYNSYRHKNNVSMWKSKEMKKLRPSKLSSLVPKTVEQVEVRNALKIEPEVPAQNQPSKIETRIFEPAASVNQNGRLKIVKPIVDQFCRVCGINIGSELQDHYKSEEHNRCAEAFCFVCDIKTMSKQQLAEHIKGIKHKSMLDSMNKDNANLRPLQKGESSNSEIIQSTNINSQIKLQEAKKETQVISKSVPLRWCYCDACKQALDGTENAESHYKTAAHMKNILYCDVCKLKFDSKIGMNFHVGIFPHNESARLMSLIVSKGISTRNVFWKIYDWQIICNLCDAYIQSESSAAGHFGCQKHILNFDKWCSAQSINMQDPNRRWYYCDICTQPLDGTTNVELHYQGRAHIKLQERSQASKACSATDISKTESIGKEKYDGFVREVEIPRNSDMAKLGIMNINSKIPSDTENQGRQERSDIHNKIAITKNDDTTPSTSHIFRTEPRNKEQSDAENRKQDEEIYKNIDKCIPSVINDINEILNDTEEWEGKTENSFKTSERKTDGCQVPQVVIVAFNSENSFDTENKQQEEGIENTKRGILKNENTTSSTNSNVKTNAIENSRTVNLTRKVEEGEAPTCLRKMIEAETEKLILSLKRIPSNEALNFLQKYVKEVENFSKNTDASSINVEHNGTVDLCEEVVEIAATKSILKSCYTKKNVLKKKKKKNCVVS